MVQFLLRSTFNNIEHQSIQFVKHSLMPWLIKIEMAIIKDVLVGEEQRSLYPKFNVDELCSKMGMSRTNLYNKVKLLTHQSLSDIIREIRLQRAAELLLSNEYNIMEVSDMMGFSETKYFREVFKKHFGMTPSDYIKMMKEKKGGGIMN